MQVISYALGSCKLSKVPILLRVQSAMPNQRGDGSMRSECNPGTEVVA
jgi:hypothetical protein